MGRKQELEEERRLLKVRLARIDAELAESGKPTAPGKQSRVARRSLRDVVLDCLLDIGLVTYSQQLGVYARARYGRNIPSNRFGTMSRDEERALRGSRPREVWLCHGLTFDRGEPIRRLWARSDWPLHERIVAPMTGRVLHLRMTARLAELVMRDEEVAADAEVLKYLVADNARDLGMSVRHGEFPLESWRDSALAQVSALEDEDLKNRLDAAERLTRDLTPHALFFGRPPAPVGLPGGLSTREKA